MKYLIPSTPDAIRALTRTRPGESKLGQNVTVLPEGDTDALTQSKARLVLIGIPEDIGIRANEGNPGARAGWEVFLPAFLNMQSNRFLHGSEVLVLGTVDVSDLMEQAEVYPLGDAGSLDGLRKLTAQVDERVLDCLLPIFAAGKIPIVIGGGHNNAYPLLRAASTGLKTPVHAINCDPHADFRSMEGRHSGNGFRYAWEEGYLRQYALLGLHEAYNSEDLWQQLESRAERIHVTTYEELFVRNSIAWTGAVAQSLRAIQGAPVGIELDLDAISHAPVSARTPSGISWREARHYVNQCAHETEAAYLHLCECAPHLGSAPAASYGKGLAYLVSDFVKAHQERVLS